MSEEKPQIGEFSRNTSLTLTPFPNGGWTVSQSAVAGEFAKQLGAYTNAESMLNALSNALIEKP